MTPLQSIIEELDKVVDKVDAPEMLPDAKWTEEDRMIINDKLQKFLDKMLQEKRGKKLQDPFMETRL